jgi:hypothetical protein
MTLITSTAMRDTRVRLAALLLGGALIVLVVASIGAIRVDAVNAAAPPASVPDSALAFAPPGRGIDVAAANARDLFTDDRRPPSRRYLMPGETDTRVESSPPPLPTILGTAMGSDGEHFATAQFSGGVASIARVGSKLGAYTVVSIERGKVVLRDAAGVRWTVDASKP